MDVKVLGLCVLLLATSGIANGLYHPRNFRTLQSLQLNLNLEDDWDFYKYLYHLKYDPNYSEWSWLHELDDSSFHFQIEPLFHHRHHKFENPKSNDGSKSFSRTTSGFKFHETYNFEENLLKRNPTGPEIRNDNLEFTPMSNTDSDVSLSHKYKLSDVLKPESNLQSKNNQRISNSKILSTLLVQDITPSAPISSLKLFQKAKEMTGKKGESYSLILDEEANSSIAENLTLKSDQNVSSALNVENETEDDSSKKNSTPPRTESIDNTEKSEKTSTTDLDRASFAASNTAPTDRSSISILHVTENTMPSGLSSENSVSFSATTLQGNDKSPTPNSESSVSEGKKVQTTINPAQNPDSSSSGEEMQTTLNPALNTGSSFSEGKIETTMNPDSNTDSTRYSSSSQVKMESTEEPASRTDSTFSSSNSVPVSSVTTEKMTDKTTEAIFSKSDFTDTETSKEGYQTETIPPDHIIEISSIRRARVIISVVFIMIALVAASVLAVYMFRIKRKAAQYDQLLLLP